MIEVTIDSIRVSLISQQRVVMLREVDGEYQLPIWIGPCEAEAIAVELHDTEIARPLTHDLMLSIVENMGGTITQIVINELQNDIFHALLHISVNDETHTIDCRPSDSLAIAVRAKVPIYVEESVLEQVGITPEPDISEAEADNGDSGEPDPPLDAFRDFLDTLDFDEE